MGYISERAQSFIHAFHGLKELTQEANFKIHICSAIAVIIFGIYLKIDSVEFCIIFVSIFIVLIAEGFNTSVEKLCDSVTLEDNILIKKSKDIAAASVLIASIMAIIVGVVIFLPKLLIFF
jgi:diacylglycerol kinase